MQALNLPDFNVFSILWGGGSTISITTIHSNGEDGGWLADKMVEYYAALAISDNITAYLH